MYKHAQSTLLTWLKASSANKLLARKRCVTGELGFVLISRMNESQLSSKKWSRKLGSDSCNEMK